MAERTDFSHFV